MTLSPSFPFLSSPFLSPTLTNILHLLFHHLANLASGGLPLLYEVSADYTALLCSALKCHSALSHAVTHRVLKDKPELYWKKDHTV
jgi:hypothetical protein